MSLDLHSRRLWLSVGGIMLAAALVCVTWWAASRFQSPSQREAAATPPDPSPVTVEVTKGDLVEQTTTLASAQRAGARDVAIPLHDGMSVITGEGVAQGSELTSGSVATWVNGRPLLALRGAFPLYRDIGEGDSGDDVFQLQQALSELGYDIVPDGNFGVYTATCVKELYRSVGAQVSTRDSAEREALEATNSSPGTVTGTGTDSSERRTDGASQPPSSQQKIMVPISEILMMPDLPARVVTAPRVGTVLSGENAKISLAGSGIDLRSEIPGNVAVRLTSGMSGTATAGDTSLQVAVDTLSTAQSPAPAEGKNAATPDQTVVTFSPRNGSIPDEWVGKDDILITVNLSEPIPDALQVPQRALAANAQGKVTALVLRNDGAFHQEEVKELGCVSGMCAIDSGSIREGDKVRVDR